MAIDPKDLIKEYYEEVSHKYELTFEAFNQICRTPFLFFRKMMESMTFPIIHIQFFGKFVVFPGSAKGMLKHFQEMLDIGKITEEEFEQKSKSLKAYIEAYDKEGDDSSDSTGEETPD